MGDIFRREVAADPEPFTGERLTTAISGQVQVEHYHRYLFARALVTGLDVLDVASGEGYGSALLAQVARSVIGTEFAGATVTSAARNFPRDNLRFLRGDARALPLADGCIDAVVSFETIEHFDRQDDFLREVRRVLRPDGRFIVSTPDRDIYSPAGSAANEFHVRELSCDEFIALLRGSFRHVAVLRQRALIGSVLLSDAASAASPLVFDRRGETHFEGCVGLPRAPYLVAVASDQPLPPLPPSVYVDRGDLDTQTRHAMALAESLQQAQDQARIQATQATEAIQRAESAATQRIDAEVLRANEATRHAVAAIQQREEALQRAAENAEAIGVARQEAEQLAQQLAAATEELAREQALRRGTLCNRLGRLRQRLLGQRP